MKKILNLSIVAALLVCLASSCGYKYETVKGDPTGARIYTLDNGLKIYMIVNKDKPRIDAQIAVKVGSKNDPRQTTGLAHYFEHLMFKGTQLVGTQNYELEKPLLDQIEVLFETYRQTEDEAERKAIYHQIDSISLEASKISIPNEYDKLMAAIGASGTNAYTSYDVTCYVENIPSNQIELWAKIQADRFENVVLRGFHTELETIYEEYNMYAAMDDTKADNALFSGLFEHHPYNTDVIGLPSHLKNPSITNVKNYHDQWYVPNNMAVVLSGDFDPDQAIKIVAKYFSRLKPNKDLKKPQFEPEKPIEAPIVKEVRGNESPSMMLGWRFPGANDPATLKLNLISSILYNGTAGLLDLDVNQQQKTLGLYATNYQLADYGVFLASGMPKQGQTLDEVKDIFMEELAKIKAGDFDDDLLQSIINNKKLSFMYKMDDSRSMASVAVNCFINEQSWKDAVVNYVDALSAITKDDIVAFANEYFGDNYVYVKKLQEKDPENVSIAKPHITPIFMNRDTSSQFLKDIQAAAAEIKPIEPVFLDFNKDMSKLTAKSGVEVLYKKNETNGTFDLDYVFEMGTNYDNKLNVAGRYAEFLGTSKMTPEEVKKAFYKIACNCTVSCTATRTYISLSGLAENMEEAMDLMETLLADAQPNPEALQMLKANILQERANAKTDQRSNFSRLNSYGLYGPKNPSTNVIPSSELMKLSDEELIAALQDLFKKEHIVCYYGPMESGKFVEMLNAKHCIPQTLEPVEESDPFAYLPTTENEVIIAPFDANQLQLFSVSNTGDKYDAANVPMVRLYNAYFGGGMNGIVFQEMREARGLCYTARATYTMPGDLKHECVYTDMIYTQNDKLIDAMTAFDDIINEMPVSQTAFNIAKESLLSNLRTQRTTKSRVLWAYLNAQKTGLDYDINKDIFEKVQGYTLDDVIKFQQENVKGRKMKVLILGRENELDYIGLKKFGKIRHISTEELFGY